MKTKLLLLVLAAMFCTGNLVHAQRTENGKALIINTSNEKEIAKIKEMLKNEDPSTYRLTITTNVGGRPSTTTLGSAPLAEVNKISSQAKERDPDANTSGVRSKVKTVRTFAETSNTDPYASDIVIIVKNIFGGGKKNEEILKALDSRLSKSSMVDLKYQSSGSAGGFKVVGF